MSDNYEYLIYSWKDMDFTAKLTNDYILYDGEKIYSPLTYAEKSGNKCSEGGDFKIKYFNSFNDNVYTTYEYLKKYVTGPSGKEKIKQLYCALEKERTKQRPPIRLYDCTQDDDDLDNNNYDCSQNELSFNLRDVSDSLDSIVDMMSNYVKKSDSSSCIHEYTLIYEQLNAISVYIKNKM